MNAHQLKEEFINSEMTEEEYMKRLSEIEKSDKLSKEDFAGLRDEAQGNIAPLSDQILSRSKETSDVKIMSVGGNLISIKVRSMLNKKEVEEQSKFFKMIKNIESVDEDYYYYLASSFLSLITVDPELDEVFWRRDDIDPYIIQQIIAHFIKEYQ